MRALCAIGAALLVAGTMSAPVRADGMPPGAAVAPPHCPCPPVARPYRHVHHYARHRLHRHWVPAALVPPWHWPAVINAPLPAPWESAYSRVLTAPVRFLRVAEGAPVVEYDIVANAYIPLARGEPMPPPAVVIVPR